MVKSNLQALFLVESEITALEGKLNGMRKERETLISVILSSGKTENRYYRLESSIRAGNRVINVLLLKDKYPDIAPKIIKETVTVSDTKKYLGEVLIDEISEKKPDTVTYSVIKKESGVIEA